MFRQILYQISKTFLLLFSYELHCQLGVMDISHQVSVIAADPVFLKPTLCEKFLHRLLCLLQSPEVGVSSSLDAALAPPDISEVYFFGGKGRTLVSSMLSYDAKLAKELWHSSFDLFLELQLAFKETSLIFCIR